MNKKKILLIVVASTLSSALLVMILSLCLEGLGFELIIEQLWVLFLLSFGVYLFLTTVFVYVLSEKLLERYIKKEGDQS